MKRILLLALDGIVMGSAYSQSSVESKTSYSMSGGLLGAVNLNKFKVTGSNSNGLEYETKTGWSLGGYLSFPLGTAVSLEPQVMYSSYRYFTENATPILLK